LGTIAGALATSRIKNAFLKEQIRRSFISKKEGYLRREASMQRLFISVAALQFALSAATAQPAPTSTATQLASLDQRSKVGKIITNKTAKPLVHLELLSAPETVVMLPVVALHLLLTGLNSGATSESGIASIYTGGQTASSEQALASGMTAAHRSIPFGTRVRVTNRANGKSVVVRINDRGPFLRGRIIDLTTATAKALDFSGLTPVTLVVISRAEHD
jgi:rare lipoprotein A